MLVSGPVATSVTGWSATIVMPSRSIAGLAELGGEVRLEVTPALHSTGTVGRPGVVVDADQPGDG